MKRNLLVTLLILALIAAFASFSFAEVKNPDTIISVIKEGIETMDPHWAYDNPSMFEVISNCYDNLLDYKRGNISEFVPMLATEVPSVKNGLVSEDGLTYTFPIREGVKFHNGDILTPEDVAYSIKRALVFDRAGGPSWVLFEPLLNCLGIEEIACKVAGVEKYSDLFENGDTRGELKSNYKEAMVKVYTDYVDKVVSIDGNKVIFHLAQAYGPFLSIMARYCAWTSIINKKWSIEQGAWDGKADNWWKYHDPEKEKDPLYKIENGTGPFILKKWVPGETVMLERFDDYWQGPAKIKNVQTKFITEWTTRKLMLQTGDADIISVPIQYLSEVKGLEGVRIIENLPSLANIQFSWTWTINAKGNTYIGSGKLDGEGIPPDFFSDIHVRRGFCYLFPYDVYISKILKGKAIRSPSPLEKPLLGFSDDPSLFYEFSLLNAKKEFEQAWDGQLWEKGCKFNIFYAAGWAELKAACDMISTYAKMINPKFEITPVGLQWSAYLDAAWAEKCPIFIFKITPDYPDPHNNIQYLMGSKGSFSGFCFGEAYRKFAEKNVDPLIAKALKETDPEKRAALYKELTQIAHDQAISLYLYQPIGHYVERTWIKGWYYNPMRSSDYQDFYSLSKGE